MLQAAFSIVVNSASIYSTIYTSSGNLYWTDFVGLAIWITGFTIEVVGDEQLKMHILNKDPNK